MCYINHLLKYYEVWIHVRMSGKRIELLLDLKKKKNSNFGSHDNQCVDQRPSQAQQVILQGSISMRRQLGMHLFLVA